MSIKSLCTTLTFLGAHCAQAQTVGSAAIQGALVDGAVTVSGATVSATRVDPPLPVVARSATSGRDGGFTIGDLPAGTYQICVHAPHTVYLNPCLWSAKPPAVKVAERQKVSGQHLRAREK